MHSSGERTVEAYTILPLNALPDSAFYIPGPPGGGQPGDQRTLFYGALWLTWGAVGPGFCGGYTLCVTPSHQWQHFTHGSCVFCRQKTGRASASSDPSHCCSSKEYLTPDRCYSHLLLRRAEGRATASLGRLCFITLKVGNLLCNMELEYSLLQIKLNSCWPFPDSYRGLFYSLVSLLQSLHSGKYITSPFVSSPPENKPHSFNLSL